MANLDKLRAGITAFAQDTRGIALTEYLVVAVLLTGAGVIAVTAMSPVIGGIFDDKSDYYEAGADEVTVPTTFVPPPSGGGNGNGNGGGNTGGGGGNNGGGNNGNGKNK